MENTSARTYGPSPRTWGLRGPRLLGGAVPRSIPTHVGTTAHPVRVVWFSPVHPHARGDYKVSRWYWFLPVGPSPRTWGLHHELCLVHALLRSIPTHVGTTRTWPWARPAFPGPSPRTWGLLLVLHEIVFHRRSIPTHVGTTTSPTHTTAPSTVHPHARGDYGTLCGWSSRVGGPSPRTWGLRTCGERHGPPRRSIPTHVGTTAVPSRACRAEPVHPHARGDYIWLKEPGLIWTVHPHARGDYKQVTPRGHRHLGPSPRTWGLLRPLPPLRAPLRSIPTHVGTTPEAHPVLDHLNRSIPTHVGTTWNPNFTPRQDNGPSPRTWGLRPIEEPFPRLLRSIPTHVGTTFPLLGLGSRSTVHPHARGDYGRAASGA